MKLLARKAYAVQLNSKENRSSAYHNPPVDLVQDVFTKLIKECSEISVDSNDKPLVVLSKNIELALSDKSSAAIKYIELQQTLEADHDLDQSAKEYYSKVKCHASMTSDCLNIGGLGPTRIEVEEEGKLGKGEDPEIEAEMGEDVPSEFVGVDEKMGKPTGTIKFVNRYQAIRVSPAD